MIDAGDGQLRSERGAGVLSVAGAVSVDEVDDVLLLLLSVELLSVVLDDEVDDVDDAPLFSELLPALSLLFIVFASAGAVEVDVAAGEPVLDEPSVDEDDEDDDDWAQATPITAAKAAEAAVTTSLVWKLRM